MSGAKWNVLGIASARRGGLTFSACGAGPYFPKGRRSLLNLGMMGSPGRGSGGLTFAEIICFSGRPAGLPEVVISW